MQRKLSELVLILGLTALVCGCQAGGRKSGQPEVARFFGSWLKNNMAIEDSQGVNPRTGLYELRARLSVKVLENGRVQGYRIAARTLFYKGGKAEAVDTSAWEELLLEKPPDMSRDAPGYSAVYSCASLVPADSCTIEVGYTDDKRVGLK